MSDIIKDYIRNLKQADILLAGMITAREKASGFRPVYDMVFVFDRESKPLFINCMAAGKLGLSSADLEGRHWRELGLSLQAMEPWEVCVQKVFATQEVLVETIELFIPTVGSTYYEITCSPIYNAAGQCEAVYSVARDITRQVKSEAERLEERAIFDQLVEKAPMGIMVVNADGTIRYLNETYQKVFTGLPKEQVLGKPASILVEVCGADYGAPLLGKVLAGQDQFGVYKRAVERDWLVSAFSLKDSQGKVRMGVVIAQEMTELVKLQQKLADSESLVGELIQKANLAVITADKDGIITYCNPEYRRLIPGNEDLVGKSVAMLAKNLGVNQDDLGIVRALRGEEMLAEHQSVKGKEWLVSSFRILGENDNMIGAAVCVQDITQTLQLQGEIRKLERFNLIGEMAASIGHEVRNPLTTVRGYMQLFQRKQAFADYGEQLSLIIAELDRANAIITEFLSLAKNKAFQLKSDNLGRILTNMQPLIQADALLLGRQLNFELGDTPDLLLDENEIRQCVLNLVRNGFEATGEAGVVNVKTYQEGSSVVLAVEDNGKGLSAEVFNSLGTPFLSTKPQGTGLGLPICYKIAERHKAKIEVDTSPLGTIFYLRFLITSPA